MADSDRRRTLLDSYENAAVIVSMERVPMRVFREFRLDFDQWYPPVRQLAGQLQFMRTHKRNRRHHRQALDTFGKHANVRCGPLSSPVPSAR